MTPEQRREMIVQTALPLIAEHGYGVSTQQIARAAGIGEATIFRVFQDKDTLVRACVAEATRPDHLLRELASISTETPLEDRLAEAVDAMRGHMGRMGAVVGALHASGQLRRSAEDEPPPQDSRRDSMDRTNAAIVELLEPDAERFRLPLETLASSLFMLVLAIGRVSQEEQDGALADSRAMVDLFLNGALLSSDQR